MNLDSGGIPTGTERSVHQAVSQCKVHCTKYKLQSIKCKAQIAKCKVHIALDNEELRQQRSNNDTNAGINVAVLFLLELSICVNYRY